MAEEILGFMARLKRHHIFRVTSVYAIAAWILIQVANAVFPDIGLTRADVRIVLIVVALGFPVALVLGWMFIPPSKEDPAKFSRWQRLHWRLGSVLSLTIIVLVTISGVYLWRVTTHKLRVEAAASSAAAVTPAVNSIPEKSVAVLPFVNESGNPNNQYFSDGLSEDLITALSQLTGLKVIGRNSAFQFRNSRDDSSTIGKKLGVAHLLEGSVRRAGDAVRVSAELINAVDGSTLWSQHYDRPYKDLFALQDDITHAVASALQAKLLPSQSAVAQSERPPSGNIAAYNAYLQGKFYLDHNTEDDYHQAIKQYSVATQLDPHYAQAYAQLSHTWTLLSEKFLAGVSAQQGYRQARAAVYKSLALDPDLAAAHGVHCTLLIAADFDWTGAETECQRALELAPNDATAMFNFGFLKATLGQPQQALELTQQALATDPLHAGWYYNVASYLISLGRLDEAAVAARKSIELQPAAEGFYAQLATIDILRGDAKAALATAQQEPGKFWRLYALAMVKQIGSDRSAADSSLQGLIDNYSSLAAYQIAEIYALRRNPEKTFLWLDYAWSNRDAGIQYLLYDPFIDRYKDDPRFTAFCKKVGLELHSN